MMTGMYPDRHGVFSNMQLIPGSDPTPWQWESSFLHCSDIFRAAKETGKTTAAVFWPVTAGNPAIDYHIADYWAQSDDETIRQAFARAGASEEVLRIADRHMHLFAGCEREHPQRDAFGMACAADIVEQFQPDLLLVHPANIDAARHAGGVFGPHIQTALDQLNDWIEGIGQAARRAGTLEDTDFFLVSDHGQRSVCRNIGLNVLFAEKGLIRLDDQGQVVDWDVWCLSNGMSALVFLKNPQDQTMLARVQGLLEGWMAEGVYGFSRIYTAHQAQKEQRFGGPFSFVLETDGYTAFGDFCTRPLVRSLTQIPGVSHVEMTVNGEALTDSLGSVVGPMTADMFIDNAGNEINAYEKTRIKLYFANASGDGLVESLVTRVYSTNISMEKLVVEQLVAGPGEDSPDSYPVLNPNTRVLGVTVKDGTCYVNFDDGFLTQTNNTTGEVVIYAIANSLIELPNVNKVQIAVNGRTDLIYRETFDLSTIFDRNLDLVYNSDGEEE